MRALSLFSGAGGMDLGFEQAGFRTVWANEFDRDAADAWKANRPGREAAMHTGDIADLLPELRSLTGTVDVLFGGPPCQSFSVAGKMDPEDQRGRLIFTFLEAVRLVRPRVFAMENVKALATLRKWAGVRSVWLERAKGLGYSVQYRVFQAADYGVPQNRERVIFLGIRNGDPTRAFEAMERRKTPAPPVRSALRSAGPYGTIINPDTCPAVVRLTKRPVLRKSPYAGMLVNGSGRPVDLDGRSPTITATIGGNKTPVVDQKALEEEARPNWFVGYHRGLLEGSLSPETVSVPGYIRRLTLKEAAAIQTFPPDYQFRGARAKQYRQIGNAVPPAFAFQLASAVRETFLDGGCVSLASGNPA